MRKMRFEVRIETSKALKRLAVGPSDIVEFERRFLSPLTGPDPQFERKMTIVFDALTGGPPKAASSPSA